MNLTSSNLLTSSQMVSHLSGVYRLTFCLIDLNAGSMPNLCSISSLGIPNISDICHAKTSRFSQRKVMSVSSYLVLRFSSMHSFLSGSLGLARTSLSLFLSSTWRLAGGRFYPEVTCMPFFAEGGRGVSLVGGLATGDLL
jgi:hypothetical protein